MSPSGKASDFDSDIRRFESGHPSQFDPLAQSVEQLPFKQWVRGSSPRRVTNNLKAVALSGFLLFSYTLSDPLPKPQFLRKAVGLKHGKKEIANDAKKLEN